MRVKEYTCTHPTAGPATDLACKCRSCPSYSVAAGASGPVTPSRIIRFDQKNLAPEAPGLRFNPSIIESGDGYLFCWRHGWAGCNVWAIRLDRQFQPAGRAKQLNLFHPGASLGREDPRWFRHKGKLHLWFIGVVAGRRRSVHTNVLFARINEQTLETEDKFLPHYTARQVWEKNWPFWDYQNELYATYSISPHRILKIESNRATLAYEESSRLPWRAGPLRGGASPVLLDGEMWHWFHGFTEHNGRRRYNVGAYTTESRPPFRITRITPEPIDVADPKTQPPDRNYADVLFCCGSLKVGNQWVLSHGVHDRFSEIRFYDAKEVERRLVRL